MKNAPERDAKRAEKFQAPRWTAVSVVASASTHQDLYAAGVMPLQLASNLKLDEQPRFLSEYFSGHGHMPSAAEFEPLLRPQWKWAAPVIARTISSRKAVPGYAGSRYANARELAQAIARCYRNPPA